MYTSFLQSRSSYKQMPWKSGPETVHTTKISPGATGCLGMFPTVSFRHTKQLVKLESWELPWQSRDLAARGLQWLLWSSVFVLQGRQRGCRKKETHLGHASLPVSCSKDSTTWLAETTAVACPRNHIPDPGVPLPSPYFWAASDEMLTWDKHLN